MSIIHRPSFSWLVSVLLVAAAVVFGLWLRSAPVADPDALTAESDTGPNPADLQPEAGDHPTPTEPFLGVVLPRRAIDVSAEASGRLLDVRVRAGTEVVRNEILATLDTSMLQHQLNVELARRDSAEARHRSSALEAEKADKDLERRQALGGLISTEEIDRARFDTATAEAASQAANAELAQATARIEEIQEQLARSSIRAPFDGTVSLRYHDPGGLVAPGTPVVRLVSTSGFMIRFAVPPAQAAAVTVGTPVLIALEGTEEPLAGVVDHVAPEVDGPSHMIFVEARLDIQPSEGSRSIPLGMVARVAVDAAHDSV